MTRSDYRLALFATLLALLVVLLGAWTRLSHAGLGCPDWPGCYGFITVPGSEARQALAVSRFPWAPLETGKGWTEMIHRYAAGTLALTVFVLALRAWLGRRRPGQRSCLALLVLGLVVLQALLGMWTVTLRLWPPVVTVHLLGGLATLGLLFLLTVRLGHPWQVPAKPRVCTLATLGLLLVVMQITLGGWVSAHYAAQACPDLPTCQGQWWPPADFAAGFDPGPPAGRDYLGGLHDGPARTAIHLAHRLGALLVSAVLLALAWQLASSGRKGLAGLLLGALLMQVGLGAGYVLAQFPPGLALAHSAGATLLLLVMILVRLRLWQATCVSSGVSLGHPDPKETCRR